jgi:hypothetical protein
MAQQYDKFFDNHPEYDDFLARWNVVTDVVDGGPRLKERDLKNFGTYLIKITAQSDDVSYYNERNKAYINGAVFSNVTESTLTGYIGMLFRTAPVVKELPTAIQYIVDDSDGNGLPLEHHSRNTAEKVTSLGRHGILVDMPVANGPITKADEANGHRASLKSYSAQNIEYWREDNSMIILRETMLIPFNDDEFRIEEVDAWRVLRLTNGIYTAEVLDREGEVLVEETTPLDASGNPFDEIPFLAIGSVDNRLDVDPLPLEPIAIVNIGHYRNVADEESSSRQLSAATPYVADNAYQQAVNNPNETDKKTQLMGEMGFVVMGSGGQAGFMQVSANTQVGKLREDKEKQMVALGAQVVTPVGPAQTAEAVRTQRAGQVSRLEIIGINISNGYTKLLKWVGRFMGVEVTSEYTLNREFFDEEMKPEELRELVAGWQMGAYPMRVMHRKMKANGFLEEDEEYEALAAEIQSEAPQIDMEDKDAV